jgi:hypothetical protein
VIMQHHVRFDMHACDRSVGRVRPANAPCAADLHVMSRERLGLDATAKKKVRPTERQEPGEDVDESGGNWRTVRHVCEGRDDPTATRTHILRSRGYSCLRRCLCMATQPPKTRQYMYCVYICLQCRAEGDAAGRSPSVAARLVLARPVGCRPGGRQGSTRTTSAHQHSQGYTKKRFAFMHALRIYEARRSRCCPLPGPATS